MIFNGYVALFFKQKTLFVGLVGVLVGLAVCQACTVMGETLYCEPLQTASGFNYRLSQDGDFCLFLLSQGL